LLLLLLPLPLDDLSDLLRMPIILMSNEIDLIKKLVKVARHEKPEETVIIKYKPYYSMSVRLQRNIPEITNFIENIALYNQNFDTYEDFEGWYNKRTEDTDEFKYIMEIYNKISS
jgi:hypothetical protein